jgi:cytochrome c oxidase assembly factor CtaG
MAEHSAPEYATAAGNDYATHEQTYEGFIHLATIGALNVAVTLIGLAIGAANHNWPVGIVFIFILGPVALAHGFKTGSRTSSFAVLVLAALALAFTA